MTSMHQDSKRSVQTKTGQKALRELSLRRNCEHTDGFEGIERGSRQLRQSFGQCTGKYI